MSDFGVLFWVLQPAAGWLILVFHDIIYEYGKIGLIHIIFELRFISFQWFDDSRITLMQLTVLCRQ